MIPEPHWKYHAVLVPLPKTAVLYTEVESKMSVIPNLRIVSIEEIRNPFLEETYEGMKKLIKKQCAHGNPNEMELFHGTKAEGVEGIIEDGFDDRYFAVGMYGKSFLFISNKKIQSVFVFLFCEQVMALILPIIHSNHMTILLPIQRTTMHV